MRLKLVAKLAALGALALVVGLIAAVKSMDFNRYKGYLAGQIRAATGRELVIAGPLELKLGPVPKIIANGVTLANAAHGSRPLMVRLERVEAEISLIQLLKREIRINRLVVSAPEILLETDAKGRGNWDFAGNEPPKVDAPTEGSPATRFSLREIKLKNGRILWRDGVTGRSETINLHKLAVQPESGSGGPLSLQVSGDVQGDMFDISGRIGLRNVPLPGKPWPVQLKASLRGMAALVEGTIAQPLAGTGLDLRLNLQGEELAELARLGGTQVPQLGPFKLSGRLSDNGGKLALADLDVAAGRRDSVLVGAKGEVKALASLSGIELAVLAESDDIAGLSRLAGSDLPSMGPLRLSGMLSGGRDSWKLADVKAQLAGNDVSGDLALVLGARPKLSGKLIASNFALAELAAPAAKPGEKLAPKPVHAAADGRLFAADTLPLTALKSMDADVAVSVARLSLGALRFADFGMEARLKDGRLHLKPLRALLAGGWIEGEASLDAAAATPAMALRLNAGQVELGRVARELGLDMLSDGRAEARLDLSGRGDSVRAVMASANGEALLSVGPGHLRGNAVEWAGGDVLVQVLGALNPLAESQDATPMQCGVARFVVKDGLATADHGLALETAKVNVVGAGTVDLRNESLDLGFSPRARDGMGISLGGGLAGVTRLRGTLAEPRLGMDELGSARAAASMGAAMATGGLSLLGEVLFDKIMGDATPCLTALGKAPARKTAPKKR